MFPTLGELNNYLIGIGDRNNFLLNQALLKKGRALCCIDRKNFKKIS